MDEITELQDEAPNRRLGRNVIIGGSLAVLVVIIVATATLGAETPTRRVDVKAGASASTTPRRTQVTETTVASTSTTTASTLEPPVTAVPATERPTAEQQIGHIFTTLFDPNATDEQQLAVIDDSSDLEPVLQAGRAHPMYKELANTTVTVERIDFLDLWSAAVTVRFSHPTLGWMTSTGTVLYVDGMWKVSRDSYCGGVATLTSAAGGPTITCDGILNPPPATTTTTNAPTTTSTTVVTTSTTAG